MKRSGFTMIELIFVIVILGILAAVAIPKLAATRGDAEISKMSTNAATVVSDVGAHYTAQGSMGANWYDMTNVSLETAVGTSADGTTAVATDVLLTDGTNTCVTFSISDANLTVSVPAAPTGTICTAVAANVDSLVKTHSFGGACVSY